MPYTPYYAAWEDDPSTDTPITAAALQNIETGVTNATTAAEAAIPKAISGVATDKVPVYNGSAWVAQKIVNAQIDAAAAIDYSKLSGVAKAVGYGTSLPGSPSDGDEYILVDSTSAPTYQWRFRYNAGSSSAYKWEFIGGAPWSGSGAGTASLTSTTYIALGGSPAFTLPNAGDYDWSLDFHVAHSAINGAVFAAVSNSIANAADALAGRWQAYAANAFGSLNYHGRLLGMSAAAVLTPYVRTGAATAQVIDPRMVITPVRVA